MSSKNDIKARVQQFVEERMQTTMVWNNNSLTIHFNRHEKHCPAYGVARLDGFLGYILFNWAGKNSWWLVKFWWVVIIWAVFQLLQLCEVKTSVESGNTACIKYFCISHYIKEGVLCPKAIQHSICFQFVLQMNFHSILLFQLVNKKSILHFLY